MINDYVCNNKESIFMNTLEYEKKQNESAIKVSPKIYEIVSLAISETRTR